MRRNQLASFLQELHPGLRVVRHSNRGEHIYHGGNDAVFLYSEFVGSVPVGDIYFHGNNRYRGSKYVNRSVRGLIAVLCAKGAITPSNVRRAYHAATA